MPRLTSHGEVVFEASSQGRLHHPFWGDFRQWWPGEPKPPAQAKSGCGSCGQGQAVPAATFASIDEWFDRAAQFPSDFHEHMKTLRDLAAQCEVCVELSAWGKPALLAMAAAKPKVLRSVCHGPKQEWAIIDQLLGDKWDFEGIVADSLQAKPFEHQLLFVDTLHRADRVHAELTRWAPHCRKWIVLHCTMTFGERGDDGGPGVLPAMRRFLKENPQWFAKQHFANNHGLTVLSCDPADKKILPSKVKMAWNYAKAVAKHVASGRQTLPQVEVEKRLDVCLTCDQRVDNRCSVCGCFLDRDPRNGSEGKAMWPDQDCPLGKWPSPPS